MSEREEDRIVAELQRGVDVETNFHRLFSRYQGPVRQFFAKRGFDPDRCDDLTQEVFFRVYRNITSYRGDADFGTWLFGILSNLYRNELRRLRAQKRSTVEVTLSEQADETQIDRVVDRDALERVERALRELPPQMRLSLTLYAYHGLRYREIAEVLGISSATVKSHLAEARKRLQGVREPTPDSSPSNSDR